MVLSFHVAIELFFNLSWSSSSSSCRPCYCMPQYFWFFSFWHSVSITQYIGWLAVYFSFWWFRFISWKSGLSEKNSCLPTIFCLLLSLFADNPKISQMYKNTFWSWWKQFETLIEPPDGLHLAPNSRSAQSTHLASHLYVSLESTQPPDSSDHLSQHNFRSTRSIEAASAAGIHPSSRPHVGWSRIYCQLAPTSRQHQRPHRQLAPNLLAT
jgi:hypothetical protein